ncbi:MAG: SBBP repeat-containing protein [bacterium]|nr:SBBP repeat-containing protein [bacterium]
MEAPPTLLQRGAAVLCIIALCSVAQAEWLWTMNEALTNDNDLAAVTLDATTGDSIAAGMAFESVPGAAAQGGGDLRVTRRASADGARVWNVLRGTTTYEYAAGVASDGLGGVYAAGGALSGFDGQSAPGSGDVVVVKLAGADGAHQWTRIFGSPQQDAATGVAADTNGNVYICGQTYGAFDGQTARGGSDGFLTRRTTAGTQVWTRIQGSTSDEWYQAVALRGTSVVVCGSVIQLSDNQVVDDSFDLIVQAFDTNGTLRWARQSGSADDDVARGIAADAAGNVYVAGYTFGDLDGNTNAGGADAFVAKWNASGVRQWTRLIGTPAMDVGTAVSIADNGTVYLAGYSYDAILTTTNAGGADAFVVRLDAGGAITAAWQAGGADDDFCAGLAANAPDSVVALAGCTVPADAAGEVAGNALLMTYAIPEPCLCWAALGLAIARRQLFISTRRKL